METKTCSRCGQEKAIVDFRPYYNGAKGHYTFCRECEKIEGRRKYLLRRCDALTEAQREELAKIEELYKRRSDKGLRSPKQRESCGVNDLLDKYLAD